MDNAASLILSWGFLVRTVSCVRLVYVCWLSYLVICFLNSLFAVATNMAVKAAQLAALDFGYRTSQSWIATLMHRFDGHSEHVTPKDITTLDAASYVPQALRNMPWPLKMELNLVATTAFKTLGCLLASSW